MNTSTANGSTMNNTSSMSGSTVNGSMTSNGSYNASSYNTYSGTSVASLPANVQMSFGKDFPTAAGNQYSWNQYGDWFSTYYTSKGRLTQYFYDQRGNGYSLSLPVIQTYVPEDIIDKALQKYGAHLYSISMVKTAEGKDAYQLGLIDRGQFHNEYLNEDGSSVASVWRVDEMNMNSSSTNAAMGDQSVNGSTDMNMNAADTGTNPNGKHQAGKNSSSNSSTSTNANSSTDTQTTTGNNDANGSTMSSGSTSSKSKTKIQNSDGTETKIKSTDNKTKIKTKGTPNNGTSSGNGNQQQ